MTSNNKCYNVNRKVIYDLLCMFSTHFDPTINHSWATAYYNFGDIYLTLKGHQMLKALLKINWKIIYDFKYVFHTNLYGFQDNRHNRLLRLLLDLSDFVSDLQGDSPSLIVNDSINSTYMKLHVAIKWLSLQYYWITLRILLK